MMREERSRSRFGTPRRQWAEPAGLRSHRSAAAGTFSNSTVMASARSSQGSHARGMIRRTNHSPVRNLGRRRFLGGAETPAR